ncbi:hypothetical protein BpHYR1_015071 [Brachionus plicatilis]|uniref:Uncharacterized protein n=1 Tax=Brachionus plicatilis TaxID=10195 RepID=A0A3M7SNA3_BRAPC|nr:hypothetical protein BpHYR1_015071 [Brachionus plicatilis]
MHIVEVELPRIHQNQYSDDNIKIKQTRIIDEIKLKLILKSKINQSSKLGFPAQRTQPKTELEIILSFMSTLTAILFSEYYYLLIEKKLIENSSKLQSMIKLFYKPNCKSLEYFTKRSYYSATNPCTPLKDDF